MTRAAPLAVPGDSMARGHQWPGPNLPFHLPLCADQEQELCQSIFTSPVPWAQYWDMAFRPSESALHRVPIRTERAPVTREAELPSTRGSPQG